MKEEIYLLKYLDNGERFWVPEKTMQHRHNAAVCTYSAHGPEEWRNKELEERNKNQEARILQELGTKPKGDEIVQSLSYPKSTAIALSTKSSAVHLDVPPVEPLGR